MAERELPYLIHTFELGLPGEEQFTLRIVVERPGDPVLLQVDGDKPVPPLPARLAKAIGNIISAAGESSIVGANRAKRRAEGAKGASDVEASTANTIPPTLRAISACGND